MAWERRERGTKYYTRSRRVGGRVVREYVGCGPVAQLAADLDAAARVRRKAHAEVVREACAKDRALTETMAALDRVCELAIEATLLAAGYHRPNYLRWRRRRVPATTP